MPYAKTENAGQILKEVYPPKRKWTLRQARRAVESRPVSKKFKSFSHNTR